MRTAIGRTAIVALGVGLASAIYARGRTAALRSATVVQIATTPCVVAEVQIGYAVGLRPTRVIIDLRSGTVRGSATLEGEEDSVHIPLAAALAADCEVAVTTATRVFGQLHTRQYLFTSRVQ